MSPRKTWALSFSTLIENPDELKAGFLEAWKKPTRDGVAAKVAPLTDELKQYVESFDFSIVSVKLQREIIEDLKETEFYRRKFGIGGLQRKPLEPIPDEPTPDEENYVQSLRQAFAEYVGIMLGGFTDQILRGRPELSQTCTTLRGRRFTARSNSTALVGIPIPRPIASKTCRIRCTQGYWVSLSPATRMASLRSLP